MSTATAFSADPYIERLLENEFMPHYGKVRQIIGTIVESLGPAMAVGETCAIRYRRQMPPVLAEVVGFRESKVLMMPLGDLDGIGIGAEVESLGKPLEVDLSSDLLGRVLDGLGRPIDDGPPIRTHVRRPITASPPDPLRRSRITEILPLGIRAIDGFLTCGKGQRVGVFAGSGVGKSTVLGMIARDSEADINVIALVGERGKEVLDFLERDLGSEGLRRSVVIVATSDQSALVRIKSAFVATTIAEYFRDQGKNVLLMMDSVTRFAMAQREVGLAIGEPTTTRGYTPSVFATLPKLLERTGRSVKGSITGLYTVLVDGDDMNEPVADAVRSILDGHIVLSRALAAANHYPAIDILQSVSRVMPDIAENEHVHSAGVLRDLLAVYHDNQDLINIGAYVSGSNAKIDRSILKYETIKKFLRQGIHERTPYSDGVSLMKAIAS